MITLSDHQHLRSQIHDALKTMNRVEFAAKARVFYSKLSEFLDGQAVSDPTYRKLRSALPQADQLTLDEGSLVNDLGRLVVAKEKSLQNLLKTQRLEREVLESELRVLRRAIRNAQGAAPVESVGGASGGISLGGACGGMVLEPGAGGKLIPLEASSKPTGGGSGGRGLGSGGLGQTFLSPAA